MGGDGSKAFSAGERVTVHTADGHRFDGQVVKLRTNQNGVELAVVRLDTGWQVTYPVTMLRLLASDK